MTEELLTKMKEELEIEKQKLANYNRRIRRIRELENDGNVQEFLKLTNLEYESLLIKRISSDSLIEEVFYHHLHEIEEKDTNGIYVYLGTYKYTDEIDIVHSSHDISVSYYSPVADYRVYQNIEEWSSKQIPISKCEQFEKVHTILNPKVSITRKGFYEIQKDFFIRAIKVNQESAKKMVLRKYRRHSN